MKMPDRPLTKEETRKFIQESATGNLFQALATFKEERTKPSLHDLCILELSAALEGQRRIVIQLGREINALKERVEMLGGK